MHLLVAESDNDDDADALDFIEKVNSKEGNLVTQFLCHDN